MSAITLRWPAEALWQALEPHLPGVTIEVLPEVDSTNSELMRRARAGHTDPVLLVAEQQTAGRGRLGRAWLSSAGDSLTFSLGLPMQPVDWSGLSLAVGVGVAESLQAAAPTGTARIGLKWPNDLWLHDGRKLGGILVETASMGRSSARYVVVGVGLNVRAPAANAALSPAPAALQELSPTLDAPAALHAVAPALARLLPLFEQQGFAPFAARFAQRDVLAGRAVALSDGLSGQAQGVGNDGALRVRSAQGLHDVTSAEVSVRPTSKG